MRISDWSSDVCSSDLGSDPRGMSDVSGTTSMAGGLGAVPVDRIGFEGATVRFDDAGKCAVAGGRIRLVVSAPIAGLDLSRGLSGPLSCANGRAQAALASQSGLEGLTLRSEERRVGTECGGTCSSRG